MQNFTFLLSLILLSPIFSQTPASPLGKYSKKDLATDLNYLDSAFRYGHPSKIAFPSDFDFRPKIKDVLSHLPNDLTKNQYTMAVREVLMEVKCLHTSYAGWSDEKSKKSKYKVAEKLFPYFVYTDGASIWISHEVNDSIPSILRFGDELISINDIKMDSVLHFMMNAHPDDGPGQQISKFVINNYFPQSLKRFIPEDSVFTVVTRDKTGTEKSTTVNACLFKEKLEIDAESVLQGKQAYFSLLNDSLGYLRIKSIAGKQGSFYEQVFQTIADSNVTSLILDLRGNPGGNLFSCIDFLGYVLPDTSTITLTYPTQNMRPFLSWKKRRKVSRNNFLFGAIKAETKEKTTEGKVYTLLIKPKSKLSYNGKLYVLTNEMTASGASMISSFARHKRESLLIGQLTGGGEYFLNAALGKYPSLVLPASKIIIQTATHHIRYDTSAAHFTGITPDISIEYDASTFGKRDLEMEKVFEMIAR